MARNLKIAKLVLHEYVQDQGYRPLYPQTSGDMVVGQVSDSKMLDGKPASTYMSSVINGYFEVKNENQIPQGIMCSRLIISNDMNDEVRLTENENSLWVKGNGYIQNGKEIATKNDIDTACTKLKTELKDVITNHSVTASRLNSNASINGVVFNGDEDINIPSVVISTAEPTELKYKSRIWINPTTSHAYYYYNNKWNKFSSK